MIDTKKKKFCVCVNSKNKCLYVKMFYTILYLNVELFNP